MKKNHSFFFPSNLPAYVSQTSEVLSNLFIYCLSCRELEGCLAKHFRTISLLPTKNAPLHQKRKKKLRPPRSSKRVSVLDRMSRLNCDRRLASFFRFSTAERTKWSFPVIIIVKKTKPISRQGDAKVMNLLFDI